MRFGFVSFVSVTCLKPAFISVALVRLCGLWVGGMSLDFITSTRILLAGVVAMFSSINLMALPFGICFRSLL